MLRTGTSHLQHRRIMVNLCFGYDDAAQRKIFDLLLENVPDISSLLHDQSKWNDSIYACNQTIFRQGYVMKNWKVFNSRSANPFSDKHVPG